MVVILERKRGLMANGPGGVKRGAARRSIAVATRAGDRQAGRKAGRQEASRRCTTETVRQ